MTYIFLLIFISLLVMPLIFLNKESKILDNNYNVEYHFGLTGSAIKEKNRNNLNSDKSRTILTNETEDSMDDILEFEDWMKEPLEWETEKHK